MSTPDPPDVPDPPDPPVLLDSYAARSCAVKTHNSYDPRVHPGRPPVDPAGTDTFDEGPRHRDLVLAELLAGPGRTVDLRGGNPDPAAGAAAMAEGADVIVAGSVPADPAGHRRGRPDVWIRGADTPDGRPGYHPVLIRARPMLELRRSGRQHTFDTPVSALSAPSPGTAVHADSRVIRWAGREAELIQVAHWWRMLEGLGLAAGGTRWGGLIGTDRLPDGQLVIAWADLDRPAVRTYSRHLPAGWTVRSVLERYDHEHSFRVAVARTALRQAEPDAPDPLVRPIVTRECARCEWWEVCRPQLDDRDLSLRIDKAPLDVREIAVLRRLGVSTIDELARADLAELLPRYLPQVRHRPGADRRLELAAHRSRLLAAGRTLERATQGPIDIPRAALEIDFDLETSRDDRVYLWGFLLRDRAHGTSRYHHVSSFTDLDADAEAALAVRAMTWLLRLTAERDSVLVYHYSAFELQRLSRLAGRTGSPILGQALRWARRHFVDLFPLVRANFFSVHGLGLKVIAHDGAGFSWRDDDPGGLNSQRWFDDAVHADDPIDREAARTRVLQYNEDDVRATAALRDWLDRLG